PTSIVITDPQALAELEVLRSKRRSMTKMMTEADRVISGSADFRHWYARTMDGLIGINSLVGQPLIKRTVLKLVLRFYLLPREVSESFLNFLVTGPPGSGKTMLAVYLGRLLSGLGLLI